MKTTAAAPALSTVERSTWNGVAALGTDTHHTWYARLEGPGVSDTWTGIEGCESTEDALFEARMIAPTLRELGWRVTVALGFRLSTIPAVRPLYEVDALGHCYELTRAEEWLTAEELEAERPIAPRGWESV